MRSTQNYRLQEQIVNGVNQQENIYNEHTNFVFDRCVEIQLLQEYACYLLLLRRITFIFYKSCYSIYTNSERPRL